MELLVVLSIGGLVFYYRKWKQLRDRYKGFEALGPLDDELASRRSQIAEINTEVEETNAVLVRIRTELKELEAQEMLLDVGFYEPRYEFETSERYKHELDKVRAGQKELLQNDKAITSKQTWTVGGNEKKGEQLTKRITKLMLRAFQGECDTIIAKVKFGDVLPYAEKIRKAREAINKLGDTWGLEITDAFMDSMHQELYLVYEYQEKLNAEREEQRRIREEMREEEKAQREAERAQQEAEREERRAQEAIEKARKELAGKQGAELEELQRKMAELEQQLTDAHARKERALSMAQQTRRGHVYVISNIGSFGEDVYKIGMTRRLEPLDRIKELGDASVPFVFDVHAIIYSDDAPDMELRLHKRFDRHRVNRVNEKREFFRVPLAEIASEVRRIDGMAEVEFTLAAEAKEYRETLALSDGKAI